MLFQIRVSMGKKGSVLELMYNITICYVCAHDFVNINNCTTSAQWTSNLGQVHNLRSPHSKWKSAPSSFISHNLEAD